MHLSFPSARFSSPQTSQRTLPLENSIILLKRVPLIKCIGYVADGSLMPGHKYAIRISNIQWPLL
jgi:hypothetical protein